MAEAVRELGITQPISPAKVEAMAGGAQIRYDGENGEPLWDPDGLRAGLADMLDVEPMPQAIEAFLRSDRVRVSLGELELLHVELGAGASPAGTIPSLRPNR
jgi:hypothetical protein